MCAHSGDCLEHGAELGCGPGWEREAGVTLHAESLPSHSLDIQMGAQQRALVVTCSTLSPCHA